MTGEQLQAKWENFLDRNNLLCKKHCCTEVRAMSRAESLGRLEDEQARQALESLMDSLEQHEKAGSSFKWDKNNHLTIRQ